jgi:hypothetical protein
MQHQQKGGWQVGTSYMLKEIRGSDDAATVSAAKAIGAEIATTLNNTVKLLPKNRVLNGELKPFKWVATQANEPAWWYYWDSLKYTLVLVDSESKKRAPVQLVFNKILNKVGASILVVGALKAVTGGGNTKKNTKTLQKTVRRATRRES